MENFEFRISNFGMNLNQIRNSKFEIRISFNVSPWQLSRG